MKIEELRLPTLLWQPGRKARVWFAQVRPNVVADRFPLKPEKQEGVPSGLDILRALCQHEAEHCEAPREAPALILLPEFSVAPQEIPQLRDLIGSARPNTLFVVGVGQMAEAEALAIEPRAALWAGQSDNRLTNCAIIGVGGLQQLYLQPKILPSRWERDYHWPGATIRYFTGDFIQFIVVLCSELLPRPEDETTIARAIKELRRKGHGLNLVIWIQHSPDPRSDEFHQSLARLTYYRATVLVVSSGSSAGHRLRNFGVSGAIVPTDCLPRSFLDLDRRFHYAEPVGSDVPLSRVVLLRYDADVYRVETILADVLTPASGAARGEFFHQASPYLLDGDHLAESENNIHLVDISRRARDQAVLALGASAPHVDAIRDGLTGHGGRRAGRPSARDKAGSRRGALTRRSAECPGLRRGDHG